MKDIKPFVKLKLFKLKLTHEPHIQGIVHKLRAKKTDSSLYVSISYQSAGRKKLDQIFL